MKNTDFVTVTIFIYPKLNIFKGHFTYNFF